MYQRLITPPHDKSFFLFGPRGTGKTTWLKSNFPNAIYLDLLESQTFGRLLARPDRLEEAIPKNFTDWVIIDEIQRIPDLLNEVHRLIEGKRIKFILTGSSARKLKRQGVNLLAGRALLHKFFPLTVAELGEDFDLERSLKYGHLPSVFSDSDPKEYLMSYAMNHLQSEVFQEGLTRNLGNFSRFLEVASFSQGGVLNISEVAREANVQRKMAESYFSILEDLMIAYQIPIFSKRAKRRLVRHNKFYFFDVGIFNTLRPKGPLDSPEEIGGMALETLVMQELKAFGNSHGYELFFWRSAKGLEVDFVLYGEKGFYAIEVKRGTNVGPIQLRGLKAFLKDYPQAKGILLYGGNRKMWKEGIEIIPVEEFLRNVGEYLNP